MSIIQALIFGLVQGLTEFIPVSSSGHLVLLHDFLGADKAGLAFDVALHGGTLLALILFFYKDIIRLSKALFVKSKETRLAQFLAVATIPAVIAGVILEGPAGTTFRSPKLVAANLILIALLMLVAERHFEKIKNPTKLNDTSLKQAILVGCAQALAIVPGISRSGSTITAGLLGGMDRLAATRFAFLLGIPIISGALLKTLLDGGLTEAGSQAGVFAVGTLAAFASGLIAIKFLLKFLAKHSLAVFAYYRIGLGILVITLA